MDRTELPKRNTKPRQPVASQDRYTKTLAQADEVDESGGLACMLVLARHTGHREGAICGLQVSDVLRTPEAVRAAIAALGGDENECANMPHGAILWRVETGRRGVDHIVPISGTVRAALDSYLNRHAGIGGAWLFPTPGDRSKPIDVRRAGRRLRAAEKLAGLPKLNWGRWHPYRRLFANERKHLPAHDVAAAGGWNDTEALTRIYQKADSRGVLRVVEAS